MAGWKKYKLGEIITLKRGYDLPDRLRKNGKYPIITSSGISNSHAEYKVKGPGVITGRYGTLGKIHFAENNFWPLNTTLYVKDFKNNSPRFIYYFLQTLNLEDFNGAAAVPGLDRNVLHKISCLFPNDFNVQSKIASILSAYDDLIEVNNQRIKLLEETARELYKEWFVRMRFPGYKKAKFVKGMPTGVGEIKYFKDFIKLNRGFDLPEHQIKEGEYPVIASTTIKAFHTHFKVKAPIITTGRSGSLGTVQYVNQDGWPLNTSLYVKDFKDNEPLYVYYTLKCIDLESYDSGAGVPTLNQNHLHKLKLWIAGNTLQKKFTQIVSPIFIQIDNFKEQNTQLRQIRDRLLPRLISGKLQVKTAQKEAKVIALKNTKAGKQTYPGQAEQLIDINHRRTVLAAYIIDKLKDEHTFGHVKLMKMLYLCEHIAHIEMNSNYHRDAAGPYDDEMMRAIDNQLNQNEWFKKVKSKKRVTYTVLAKKNEYVAEFEKYFSDTVKAIDSLLQIFGTRYSEKAEMVATVHKSYYDLKNNGKDCTVDAVVYDVLNNWHDSKKKIEEKRWINCYNWMLNRNWIG